MTAVVMRRRMPPLATGTTLAILLHGLLLLLLLVQLSHPVFVPPEIRKLTIIELQPHKNALALAQLPSPPPASPKTPPKPKAAPKIHPPPLQHPSEKLLATIPPPAPPRAFPAPPTPPTPALNPTTTTSVASTSSASPDDSSAGRVGRIPQLYLMEVSRIVSVHTITPLKARDSHERGSPVIRIHLRRDGTVIEASVFRTSGFPDLDESAVSEMGRIGKFPELAAEYAPGEPDFFIDQPVGFHTE